MIDESIAVEKLVSEYLPSEAEILEVDELNKKVLLNSEFPWERALDTYDPTFPGYTPSKDAIEFFVLMRLVHGKDFEVGNSVAHYFMVDLIFGNVTSDMYPYAEDVKKAIEVDPDRIAICCSRGLSKSTIITNFLFIYVALKGKLPHGGKQSFWLALGASSKGHARNMAISLRAICEDSKYLNDVMEYMRFTETEAEFLRKGTTNEESRYFCIRFMGVFTPTRGQKNKFNARPDVAVLDDCLPSHSAAYSKTIMATLTTAIHSDLGNALKARGGKIFNIFTPFNFLEPNTASILNKSFTPLLIPVAKQFNEENLDSKSIQSSWPQMHTQESIFKMWKLAKNSNTMKLFMQERMLRLTSGSERLVPDSCIQWCDMSLIEKNIHGYSVYITTDYTTTSGESSDYSGRATWALSNNEDIFLLDLRLNKTDIETQHEDTLESAAKYKRRGKYVEIGVELDGGQGSHVHALEKIMMQRGDYYSFAKDKNAPQGTDAKGIRSRNAGAGKHERFRVAVSQYMLPRKMWFPEHLRDTPDMIEFIQQIKGATHSTFTRSDDGPDLISQLSMMKLIYPTEAAYIVEEDVSKKQPNKGHMWARLKYGKNNSNSGGEYSSYV